MVQPLSHTFHSLRYHSSTLIVNFAIDPFLCYSLKRRVSLRLANKTELIDDKGGVEMSLEDRVVECGKCGGDHIFLTEDGAHYKCQDCWYIWPTREEVLTSSQQYFKVLRNTLGRGNRELARLRQKLGNIQITCNPYDHISIVVYPGGGKQTIPVPLGTVAVDGQRLTLICLSGKYPHVVANIEPTCSGEPYPILCHIKV